MFLEITTEFPVDSNAFESIKYNSVVSASKVIASPGAASTDTCVSVTDDELSFNGTFSLFAKLMPLIIVFVASDSIRKLLYERTFFEESRPYKANVSVVLGICKVVSFNSSFKFLRYILNFLAFDLTADFTIFESTALTTIS